MKGIIEHIDLLPDGVVVIFADGREAWLSQESIADLSQSTSAFETLRDKKLLAELDLENDSPTSHGSRSDDRLQEPAPE